MNKNDSLKFFVKETEDAVKHYNHLKEKNDLLRKTVTDSMDSKRKRFEEKRVAREKEFKFLRNK